MVKEELKARATEEHANAIAMLTVHTGNDRYAGG